MLNSRTTPLMRAIQSQDTELAERLLQINADVNAVCLDGVSLVWKAFEKNARIAQVQYLSPSQDYSTE